MFFFILILSIILLLIFSKIRIQIINLSFSSEKKENRHLNQDYKILIYIYILGIIPILKINITKNKLERLKIKEKIEKVDFKLLKDTNNFDIDFIKAIKTIKLDIKKINLQITLGTENAFLTSMIVPALSTVISIILNRKIEDYNKQIFIINPIYKDKNIVNVLLSGIFELKMIHIINTICTLNIRRRVDKHVRASNRRAYDYSYE